MRIIINYLSSSLESFTAWQWIEMRRDGYRRGDDEEIFDDILPFERGDHKSAPCDLSEHHERQCGCEHMYQEQRNDDAFKPANGEEDADNAFEDSEESIKCCKW